MRGRALTSTSILVQWDPPLVEHQNGEIESYIIICIEQNTGRTLRLDTTPITNVTISELHPFYSYVCNVSAVTVDSGPFSDTINVTTLEDGTYIIMQYFCYKVFAELQFLGLFYMHSFIFSIFTVPSSPPYNLTIEEISSHNVSLAWTAPDIQQRNGIIQSYIIHVVPRESIWLKESVHITPSSEVHYTVTGLHPYTTYDINVAAVTIAQGPNSSQLLVRTDEDGKG